MTKRNVGVLFRGFFMMFAGLLLAFSLQAGQETVGADAQVALPQQTPGDPVFDGRLEEAQATGELIGGLEAGKLSPKRWDEQLDGGDDPLTPGCACQYQQANCGGKVVGRTVDECYPSDGVTLHEKTVPSDCGHYSNKEYNCEELLGKGARCMLKKMVCCGVATTSGYCFVDIEP